jgi:hypothetical protein
MSKKYQYFAKKRKSPLYESACEISYCKIKKSHFYTTNCFCCINKNVGQTRLTQQINDKQKIIVPL